MAETSNHPVPNTYTVVTNLVSLKRGTLRTTQARGTNEPLFPFVPLEPLSS